MWIYSSSLLLELLASPHSPQKGCWLRYVCYTLVVSVEVQCSQHLLPQKATLLQNYDIRQWNANAYTVVPITLQHVRIACQPSPSIRKHPTVAWLPWRLGEVALKAMDRSFVQSPSRDFWKGFSFPNIRCGLFLWWIHKSNEKKQSGRHSIWHVRLVPKKKKKSWCGGFKCTTKVQQTFFQHLKPKTFTGG